MPEDIPVNHVCFLEGTHIMGLNLESSMGKSIITGGWMDRWIRLDSRQMDGLHKETTHVWFYVLELVICQPQPPG